MKSPLIPRPLSVVEGEGSWTLASTVASLARASGLPPHEERLEAGLGLGSEGYRLDIGSGGAVLAAEGEAGLRHARTSLRQLVEAHATAAGFSIPAQTIVDRPRHAYRGLMLDVSRHFFDAKEVLRLIDLAADLKLNVFHWHLTDDQGWRLPVPAWPRLTAAGPAYTTGEIRAVVAHAEERGVTILPEVDLPGHFRAALAAYPELGCSGLPLALPRKPGIYADIACAGSDATLGFLEDVLSTLVDLFPGPWVHLGGDEAPKLAWDDCPRCRARARIAGLAVEGRDASEALQGWLTNRLAAFLAARGRKAVVWNDSLVSDNLAPGAVVMYWQERPDRDLARNAVLAGRSVIVADCLSSYFDYPRGLTPLRKVYAGSPWLAALPAEGRAGVLGLEAALWTEFVETRADLDARLFPRLAAQAERAWTAEERLDYADFKGRAAAWREARRAEGVGALTVEEADPPRGSPKAFLEGFRFIGRAVLNPALISVLVATARRKRRMERMDASKAPR